MSRITLLCLARHRDEVLDRLREAGVLHLDPWQPPGGTDLESARDHAQAALADLEWLSKIAAGTPGVIRKKPAEVLSAVRKLRATGEARQRELENLRKEEALLMPFGDFDRKGMLALVNAGIPVRLLRLPPSFTKKGSEAPLEILQQDRQAVWAVQFGSEPLPEGATEISLPTSSPGEIREAIANRLAEQKADDQKLASLAAEIPELKKWVIALQEKADFHEAASGLAAHGEILALRGFCPADQTEEITRLARERGWGILVDEPSDGDRVPTLLRNSRAARPAQTILRMLGILPGYREVDIGAAFLFFFSIFFAMIIGDAAYGAIFLGLTLWARKKKPSAPAEPFHLMILLSSSTIVWGLLSGTIFGMSVLPSFFQKFRVDWLMNESNVIRLCFFIGAVQLSFAHLWNAWIARRSMRALGQLGWMATTWTMFYGACHLIVGDPLPSFLGPLFITGVVLIVFFMTPLSEFKKEWTGHAMLPLSLVNNFVDVVSYVRLFAVGTAGLAVETSFNAMAASQGFNSVLSSLIAALILFFGHALNMTLGAMGILVHGIRLNTLEFSGHMGLTWSGVRYVPFARRTEESSTNG